MHFFLCPEIGTFSGHLRFRTRVIIVGVCPQIKCLCHICISSIEQKNAFVGASFMFFIAIGQVLNVSRFEYSSYQLKAYCLSFMTRTNSNNIIFSRLFKLDSLQPVNQTIAFS